MECARLQNWHAYWDKRKKCSSLDLDSGYMGNIYLLYVRLSGQLKKGGRASYIGYTAILISLIK